MQVAHVCRARHSDCALDAGRGQEMTAARFQVRIELFENGKVEVRKGSDVALDKVKRQRSGEHAEG